jgi:tetratricopeptide (TPR) repeat protein
VDEWFERALSMEDLAPSAAIHAYQRCLEVDPDHLGARINCGRLLHEAGELDEAERLYRAGLRDDVNDPTLLFNLAVLLEDTRRRELAMQTYQAVLVIDPDFADAHYNLARLHEAFGNPQHALRHLACYRKITASTD